MYTMANRHNEQIFCRAAKRFEGFLSAVHKSTTLTPKKSKCT